MSSVLRPGGELCAEYPLVFGEDGPGDVFSICEGGQTLSACAVLERELIYPGGRVRVGFIGSVATHTDARGRGLATQLLCDAEDALRERGCEYALLWADEPEFYARRGYALDGEETDFLLNDVCLDVAPLGLSVRPLFAGEEERLHDLYNGHGARVERSLDETKRLLACPQMRILLATRSGEVVSYVCFGRGADLGGVAHEWGGESEGVLACLADLLESSDSVFVMAPGEPGAIGALLESCGAICAKGRLGMAKSLGRFGALPRGAFVWGLDSI